MVKGLPLNSFPCTGHIYSARHGFRFGACPKLKPRGRPSRRSGASKRRLARVQRGPWSVGATPERFQEGTPRLPFGLSMETIQETGEVLILADINESYPICQQ